MRPWPASLAGCLAGLLLWSAPAWATFPGSNGKIAVTSRAQVSVMNHDGTGLLRLTPGDQPAFSPDASRIAFESVRDGDLEIFSIPPVDGRHATQITRNAASDADASWSPDGSRIAFTSDRDGNDEIYVMSRSGAGQTRLTNDPASDVQPTWSPDGTRIAFQSDRDGDHDLYTMSAADGSGLVNVTRNASFDADPSWAPDGTRLALTGDYAGRLAVYVVAADGAGGRRRVAGVGSDPTWSPDGTRIAHVAVFSDIGLIDPDGGNRSTLADSFGESDPDWAPLPPAEGTPVAARTVDVQPVSGDVDVKLRGAGSFVDLVEAAEIRTGSTVDTRDGTVKLTSATPVGTQSGTFSRGAFKVAQPRPTAALTEMTLAGGDFARCGGEGVRPPTAARRRKRIRGLFANTRGAYRVNGRYAHARSKRTRWSVEDFCEGTLVRVRSGVVRVRDHALRRTVTVRAGGRYLARRP
jgi:dipeptidyl aminopeptidase/acylaminoacyl peptidase